MQAEIVSVGSEILLGDLVDTNSAHIAQQLKELGINLFQKTVAGDNKERLRKLLAAAVERSDLVITTGGIGPTVDDVTREAAAEAVGADLEFRQDLLEDIERMFRKRSFNFTPNNRKQAYIPRGGEPIHNPVGTAPGFIVQGTRGIIVSLPGVPHEMKFLMETVVLPHLKERFGLQATIITRTLKLVGIGESHVDAQISDLMEMGPNPTVGLLAKQNAVEIRITAKAETEEAARRLTAGIEEEVRRRFGNKIFGADDDTIEGAVADLLVSRGLSLALLETLTGGAMSVRLHSLGDREGTFKPFLRETLIAPWPAEQQRALGIDESLYTQYGAYSREVAETLAGALKESSGADLAMCVLGHIADDGETHDRYHAQTHMALTLDGPPQSREDTFGGPIPFIKNRITLLALECLRRFLVEQAL